MISEPLNVDTCKIGLQVEAGIKQSPAYKPCFLLSDHLTLQLTINF